MAHFQLEEWDKAIDEWESGFRIKPVSQFLYNIAQAYRVSKRPEKALAFYQKYLRMEPNAENRAEVDRYIAALTKQVGEQPKASSASAGTAERQGADPKSGAPPASASEPQSSVSSRRSSNTQATTPTSTSTPAGVESGNVLSSAPQKKKPLTKTGWFWGVIGGVGAVVVAGVVLSVVLGTNGGGSAKVLPAVQF